MKSRDEDNNRSGPSRYSRTGGGSSGGLLDHAPFVLFVVVLVFLAFIGGAIATIAEMRPSGYLRDAYRAGSALYEKYTRYHDPMQTDLWADERTPDRGLTRHLEGQAQEGLTLYTSGHANKAFLIDMQGNIVHEWERPYSTVWDQSAAVRAPAPDERTNILKARVMPNGDLLALYTGVGDTPYGYGLAMLDRNSELIWKNLDYFHHDFDVGSDGRIYGLTQAFRGEAPEGVDHVQSPYLDDYLAILSPDGLTLQKISLMDAIHRSEFRRLLWLVPYYSLQDPLHTNNVDVLDEQEAERLRKKIPAAAAGQVLLSFREVAGGTIALLDIESETIVWAARGPWLSQHDPDVLPNGNILMFDNRGYFGEGGDSRVIEIDPASGAIEWQYAGSADRPLLSHIRSDQQMLPNGNILITESDGGRLLEVNRDGDIVWEFINPVRGGHRIPVVNWAQRIDPGTLEADFLAGLMSSATGLAQK
jgi:hypothetical protein